VTVGWLAFKFGRGKSGMRRDRHEADLYRRSTPRRRSMLCPVLWCSRPAFVSIMRRATTPVTKGALDERKGVAWLEWDYAGPTDDALPFEWKPSDWGYLDGRIVAVDYAALPSCTTFQVRFENMSSSSFSRCGPAVLARAAEITPAASRYVSAGHVDQARRP
jgi:hypothetical protein